MFKFCTKCIYNKCNIDNIVPIAQNKLLATSFFENQSKQYSSIPKRFYKSVNILCNDDGYYEVALDSKKLKTTVGNPLKINNQALTLAVAAEWDAQKDKIQKDTMYLTALCSFMIDNPNNITKSEIVQNILNTLDTDTVLFYAESEIELYQIQQELWEPIIHWFNNEFDVHVKPTTGIHIELTNADLKQKVQRYLNSFEFTAVYGFLCVVDTLKSFILATACIKRFITVENAVSLSRLEEDYQSNKWGKVEWSHGINEADTLARASAAVLFIHLNCSKEDSVIKKRIQK